MAEVETPELPYKVIGKGSNRNHVRAANKEVGAKLSRETYMIPFKNISLRDGFNIRTEYDPKKVEEMAGSLAATGLNSPLSVDLVLGGKKPRYVVEIGHYRWMGMDLLQQRKELKGIDKPGLRDGYVECFVNNTDIDEESRIVRLISSNQHTPLTPLETAEVCQRLKRYYNHSSEHIGDLLGMSRQSVDNHLVLADQPDHIKQSFKKGNITLTQILEEVRTRKRADKAADKKEEDSHKTSKRTTGQTTADKIEMPDTLDHLIKDAEEELEQEWPTAGLEREEPEIEEEPQAPTLDRAPIRIDQSNPDAERKEEVLLCNRVIQNADKLAGMAEYLADKALSADFIRLINFIQKDMEPIREYVKKCRK